MKGEQEDLKKAASSVGQGIKEDSETVKDFKETIQRATRKGATPQTALGLTDDMVEGIYGQAYRLYNTGKYPDAIQLFRLLLMINSLESKYAMGLSACFHMQKEYKKAVDAYTLVSILDPISPICFYHCSDCYIHMNDPMSAIVALKMAIKRAGDKPEFKALKDRSLLTIESLNKEVGKV